MRYIKLFEGFNESDWMNIKQNIDEMLSAELRDVGLLYSIYHQKYEKSLMSRSGETRISIIVVKNIQDIEDNDDFGVIDPNRNVFDLSLAFEPTAFVVDYLKDKYGRKYSGSSRVEGFSIKYSYTTHKPEFGTSKFVELGSYELANLDKLNIRIYDRKTIIGSSLMIEIKIWD